MSKASIPHPSSLPLPQPPYHDIKNDYLTSPPTSYAGSQHKFGRTASGPNQSVGVSLITYAQPPPPQPLPHSSSSAVNAALSSSNNSSNSGGGRNHSNKRSAPSLSNNNNQQQQSSSPHNINNNNGCISQTAATCSTSTIIPPSNGLLHPKSSPYGNNKQHRNNPNGQPPPNNVVYSGNIVAAHKQQQQQSITGEPVDPNRARANLALALAQNLPYHQPIALPSLCDIQLAAGFAPLRTAGPPPPPSTVAGSTGNNLRNRARHHEMNSAGNNCKHSQTGQHYSLLGNNNCSAIRPHSFANGPAPCQSSTNRFPNRSPNHSLLSLNGFTQPTNYYPVATLHSPTATTTVSSSLPFSSSTATMTNTNAAVAHYTVATNTAASATTAIATGGQCTENIVSSNHHYPHPHQQQKSQHHRNGSCSPSKHHEFGSNDSELHSGDSNVSPVHHSTLNKRLSSLQPIQSTATSPAKSQRTSRSSNNSPKKSPATSFRKLLVRKQSGDALLDLVRVRDDDTGRDDERETSETTLERLRPTEEILQVRAIGSQSDQDCTTTGTRNGSDDGVGGFVEPTSLRLSKKGLLTNESLAKPKVALVRLPEKTKTKTSKVDKGVDDKQSESERGQHATTSDVCSTLEAASQTDPEEDSDERMAKDLIDYSESQRLPLVEQRTAASSSSCAIKSNQSIEDQKLSAEAAGRQTEESNPDDRSTMGKSEFEPIEEDNVSSCSASTQSDRHELVNNHSKTSDSSSSSSELASVRCKQSELCQVLAFRLVYTSLTTASVKLKWSQTPTTGSTSGLMTSDGMQVQINSNVQSFQVEMWQGRGEHDRLTATSLLSSTNNRPHSRLVYNGPVKHCKVMQLLPEQEYSFRVRAVGSCVNNAQQMFLLLSNTLTITTPKCNAPPIVNGISAQQLVQQPLFTLSNVAAVTATVSSAGGRKRNSSRQSLQQQIAQQQLITQQLLLQQQQQQRQQQQLMQQQQDSANRSSSAAFLLTFMLPWAAYSSRFSRDQHWAFGLLVVFCGVACTVAYMAQQLIDG